MEIAIRLEPLEARAFGVLIEKALTTPEQYPLTLNAVVLGANQKVNRWPVLQLSEIEVSEALDGLIEKELARKVFPGNSRVDKYAHTGTSLLKIEVGQLALLAELMMRGPQTAAELRTRAGRMVPAESQEQFEMWVHGLEARGMVSRLPPSRGSRAERLAQVLCPGLHLESAEQPPRTADAAQESTSPPRAALHDRISALEVTVARLEAELRALADKLGEPLDA
ncbi:MAG: DUF480 domain-containing protein [Candidatus Binatia bacterium]